MANIQIDCALLQEIVASAKSWFEPCSRFNGMHSCCTMHRVGYAPCRYDLGNRTCLLERRCKNWPYTRAVKVGSEALDPLACCKSYRKLPAIALISNRSKLAQDCASFAAYAHPGTSPVAARRAHRPADASDVLEWRPNAAVWDGRACEASAKLASWVARKRTAAINSCVPRAPSAAALAASRPTTSSALAASAFTASANSSRARCPLEHCRRQEQSRHACTAASVDRLMQSRCQARHVPPSALALLVAQRPTLVSRAGGHLPHASLTPHACLTLALPSHTDLPFA